MKLRSKLNRFIRGHAAISTLIITAIVALGFGVTGAAIASEATSVDGILALGKSVDFYSGLIVGAPIGYGFAQRTIVVNLKEQVDSMKTELNEWDQIKKKAFDEKIGNSRHEY